jgi:hypothetical protein
MVRLKLLSSFAHANRSATAAASNWRIMARRGMLAVRFVLVLWKLKQE